MLPRRGQAVCPARGEDPRGQDASLIPLRHKSKTPGTDMTAMPSVSVARRQNGNMWRFCAGWGARFVRSAKIIGEIGAARTTEENPCPQGRSWAPGRKDTGCWLGARHGRPHRARIASKSKTVTKMYGSHLRSRRRARQITIRVICYNN